MTATPFKGQRCRVTSYGFGTVINTKPGWVLIEFDDTSKETSWFLETLNIEFDEPASEVDLLAQFKEELREHQQIENAIALVGREYIKDEILTRYHFLCTKLQIEGNLHFPRSS